MKFADLLQVSCGDMDIFHSELDVLYPSLVDFNIHLFTPYALKEFEQVLQADVKEIEGTRYGLRVVLENISHKVLDYFAHAHSGDIDNSEYEKLWIETD